MKTSLGAILAVFLFAVCAFNAAAQTRIDVLVVYTAQARSAAGGTAGIISRIDAAMVQANTSLANSLTDTTMHLAHAAEVSYAETANLTTELNRLRHPSDGYMDNVHALRNTHAADLVVLLTGRTDTGGYAGMAYLMKPVSSSFDAWAFSVVRQDQALFHTFIHEIGHNMGGHHARPETTTSGAYAYSFGHRFSAGGTQYRTVMAYAPGTRISYFSNPGVNYNGTATGVAEGQANPADNAKTIRNTRATVAAFRSHTFTFRAVALTNNIVLRWMDPLVYGASNRTVHIRHDTTTYPSSTSAGSPTYQGTNLVFEHTGLTPGQPYYYTIFVSNDGTNFFEP